MNSPAEDSSVSNDNQNQPSVSLRSGTGAPIFEHGATTRIRRNPIRAIAALTWDDGPREIFGQLVDVSLSGCLLKTAATIATGTEVRMTITLVGGGVDEEYSMKATVRRSTTCDGRRAYGLEFSTAQKEDRRQAQALYAQTAH